MSEHIEAVLHRLVHEKIVDGSIKGDPIMTGYDFNGVVKVSFDYKGIRKEKNDNFHHKSIIQFGNECLRLITGNEKSKFRRQTDRRFKCLMSDGSWKPLSSCNICIRKELQVLCELCKNDPLPQINSNQDIVIQNYNDRFSIGYKAENDMILGHENKIVGSNTESMQTLKPRDIVVITDSRKSTHISSVERKATDEEANVWKNNGGRKWKNNYIVRPLTPVIKLEKSLNSRSGCCQNGIVKKLMKEILSKIKEEDN